MYFCFFVVWTFSGTNSTLRGQSATRSTRNTLSTPPSTVLQKYLSRLSWKGVNKPVLRNLDNPSRYEKVTYNVSSPTWNENTRSLLFIATLLPVPCVHRGTGSVFLPKMEVLGERAPFNIDFARFTTNVNTLPTCFERFITRKYSEDRFPPRTILLFRNKLRNRFFFSFLFFSIHPEPL